jgi:hypothetical protein
MSTLKQVQDLEKQLMYANQQLGQMKNIIKDHGFDIGENFGQPGLNFPELGASPQQRLKPPVAQDFSKVRTNLRKYAKGLFKEPAPYRPMAQHTRFAGSLPELPPKHVADRLLQQYYTSIHTNIPILHWGTFTREYDAIYQAGSLQGVLPTWRALLFSVFACGVLNTTENTVEAHESGKKYMEVSMQFTDLWNDEFTIDHVRQALLVSIFLYELNFKSAAWIWFGSSLRIAQDIGLHCESGPWSPIEAEMRRRVWWGIYVWDR